MMRLRGPLLVSALVLAGLLPALGLASPWGHGARARVVETGAIDHDLVAFGGAVEIDAVVSDDVIAAGRHVSVDGQVKGDLAAAGGHVDVRASVGDDALVAGGYVTVGGPVGDDLRAAGGRVKLANAAVVTGDVYLAGGEVWIAGRVGEDARAAGRVVTVSGHVGGDAFLAAGEVEITATAVIDGNLSYRSPAAANIAEGARIAGEITYRPLEARGPGPWLMTAMAGAAWVVWTLGLMVVGIALYLILPRFTVAAARNVGRSPWKSFGLGLAMVAATPLAIGLLFATVIGFPLGLVAVALYLVALMLGFVTAAFYLGEAGALRLRRGAELGTLSRIVSLVAAIAVLFIVGAIPWLGGLILFVVLFLGLGAWTLEMYRAYSRA